MIYRCGQTYLLVLDNCCCLPVAQVHQLISVGLMGNALHMIELRVLIVDMKVAH